MQILKMTIDDLERIGNILQDEFDDFWNYNILKQELLKKDCKYVIAKSDQDEILGFAGILVNPDIVEIMNIVVRKVYRNKGVGQILLEELIKISKKTGLSFLNLEVNETNKSAIHLYEKNGFKQIGKRPNYYKENSAIIMQLDLNKKL